MKKIIALIFVLMGFIGFGFANLPTDECVSNPMKPGCDLWETTMKKKCTDGGGIPSINGTECSCTRFVGTPHQDTLPCDQVKSLEDIALDIANCAGGVVLKDGTCCPNGSYPYDPSGLFGGGEQFTKCCNGILYDDDKKCCEQGVGIRKADGDECLSCDTQEAKTLPDYKKYCSEDVSNCDGSKVYEDDEGLTRCCPGMLVKDDNDPNKKVCIVNNEGNMGINMNADCLVNGQCSYNIYETLGIRKSDPNPSVGTFVQDIVLAATTFIGTVVAIILVTSGILYVVASIKGSSNLADMAKKGITGSLMGILLVVSSYAIVRLIQFFATAGGG